MIGPLSMTDLSALRKMTLKQADAYLAKFNLSVEDFMQIRPLIGKDLDEQPIEPAHHPNYYSIRRLWFATGHLLGGSFRQLAYEAGISSPSVIQAVSRVLPTDGRAEKRIRQGIQYSQLLEYKVQFDVNLQTLINMTPVEAATWLNEHTQLDTL